MFERMKTYCRRFRAVIKLDGVPYLARYRLIKTKWFSIYLHHILTSDQDRNMHDHPFNFTTFILWGGYLEHTPRGAEFHGRFETIRHKATDLHRLELEPGVTAWTLFMRGPTIRRWGFQTAEGWIDWQEYEALGEMTGRPANAKADPAKGQLQEGGYS